MTEQRQQLGTFLMKVRCLAARNDHRLVR